MGLPAVVLLCHACEFSAILGSAPVSAVCLSIVIQI